MWNDAALCSTHRNIGLYFYGGSETYVTLQARYKIDIYGTNKRSLQTK